MVVVSNTRHAWRREPRDVRRWRALLRYLGMVGVLALACAAVAGLASLLHQPFEHPRVQFLFMSGADLSGNVEAFFDQPGMAFPAEELAGLTRARRLAFGAAAKQPLALDRWRSASDVSSLSLKLIEPALAASDVAVIEIVAAGVSVGGEARLCWNFRRSSESADYVRVSDVLQQITAATPARKLLILDAGDVEALPDEGMLLNDFPRLLEKAVENTGDESLWVLCSHGTLETSHVLETQRRSVFGYYLELGLTGAADLNGDRQINVGELHGWVAHAVANYVDRRTGGMESQTPRLLWGGGPRLSEGGFPILVPVPSSAAAAETAEKEPAATATSPGAGPEKTGSAADGAPDSKTSAGAIPAPELLVQEGWRLAEQLRHRTAGLASAVDLAPRLFLELTDRLRAAEILSQGANSATPADLSNSLLPIVVPLRGITSNPPELPGTGNGLGARLARRLGPLALPPFPTLSLALAELLADRNLQPLPEGFKELSETLDKFVAQEERSGFDEWLAKLRPNEQRLAELQGLETLARVPDLDWPLLRKALIVRRMAERTAVRSLESLNIVAADILRGDRSRIAAEKLLVDGVQRGRSSRAEQEFNAAAAAYMSAQHQAEAGLHALQQKNDLVVRARDYVRWRRAAARRSDTAGPEFNHVADFLRELKHYCDLVERQEGTDLTEIADLELRLKDLQRRIEASLAEDAVQRLAASPSGPEDIAQLESLLATAFVPSGLRPQVQTAGQAAASAISLAATAPEPRRAIAAPRIVLQRQRLCLSQQIDLELLLVQLAEITDDGSLPEKTRPARLLQAADAVRQCERECTEHPESTQHLSAWRDACGAFGRELRSWHQKLPERLEAALNASSNDSSAPETVRARLWRGVPRTVGRLSARGRHGAAADDLISQTQRGEWGALLAFQARRALAALPDASPPSAEYQAATAEIYRQAATAIRQVPTSAPYPAPSLRLSGEAELSLSQETERELIVTVQNRRAAPHNAWVVVDYDRELLDVRLPADYVVYREPTPAAQSAAGARDLLTAYHPADQRLPPSLTLAPGAERALKFVVRRRGSRSWPAKLIVKAAAEDSDVRYECTVHIPAPEVIELAVDGPDKSWTATPFGFVLHPFPNQRTAFQLLLRNRGPARVLDLELYPLERPPAAPLPVGTLPKDQAESLLRGLALGPRLAAVSGFKLEGDDTPHAVHFTGPAPPDPDKPMADDKGAGAKKAGVAELPWGALLVGTEPASGGKIIKRLEFAPQRPRRYVTSRVEYQPDLQVLHVVVQRRAHAASPARIKVHCALGNISDPAAPRRHAVGEIAEGQSETRFALPVPTAVEGLHLGIAIDEYPRAFLYRVSALLPGGEVPEDTGSLAVRVTAPESQGLFACPRKFVAAAVEVDAPPGSLPDAQGFWEVGIDKDLDRELTGDNVIRFATDRQARPELSGYFPDGRLAIDTQVGDFQVQLPADGLCNQRALVVAHASVLGRIAWSVPIEIVLDGSGPRVTHVAAGHDRPLVAGEELEVTALVLDGELSGVAKVEMAFDLEGTGRFAKEPPPLPAALAPQGGWKARLATEKMPPGSHMILVRATDKVGNLGEYGRTVVTLYSPEDLERQRSAIRVAVRGVVEYNKMPVPGVKVSLVPAEPDPKAAGAQPASSEKTAGDKSPAASSPVEPIPVVKTDKDGMFVLPKVPLGKFKLQAEGIFRNKIRKAELDITVDEQTPFSPAPRLKLP